MPPVQTGEHHWELEESRAYHLRAVGASIGSARLDVRELRRIDARSLEISIEHWTAARLPLEVEVADEVVCASIRVRPRSEKLEAETWLRLVQDLEEWLPGISVGATGGTSGRIGIEGIDSPGFAAAALLPLVPALVRALRSVTARPRDQSVEINEHVRLHSVRRADANTMGWLTRHGNEAAALDGWRSAKANGPEPFVPQWRSEDSLDHPVNRYVAWATERASARLVSLGQRLSVAALRADGDTAAWCEARAAAAQASAAQLATLRTRSFLRHIPMAPPTETSLLAIRDDPAYSRFHKLVRPFLHPRFNREADDRSPARPTYELYELWTFLAIMRALEGAFPGRRTRLQLRDLDDALGAKNLARTRFELEHEAGVLRLCFNMTFPSYFAANRGGPHSISGERRPDIVVEWSGNDGKTAWLFLDAKYRVSQSALYESFESVHIYQHALRWPANGGSARAGYLLVPAALEDTAEWFDAEFHTTHRCGCFLLRPGGDASAIVSAMESLLS